MRIRRRLGRLDCRLAQVTAALARAVIPRTAILCAAMTVVVLSLLTMALCGPLRPLWAEDAEPTVEAPHAAVPPLLISEVMVAPLAVNDENGEWIEVFNAGPEPVNLRLYVLQTNAQRHMIEQDVGLAAGGRALLARSADPTQNGGLAPDYVYADLLLGNESDSLALLAPDEVTLDYVAWGEGAGLAAPLGASLERQGDDAGAAWTAAWSPWPASAGDLGSPGAAYAPPPAPSETATASPAPAATPTLMPTILPPPPAAPRLWLSEVMADPAVAPDEAGEWLELYNGDAAAVNLQGWTLADLDSDRTSIAAEVWLQPGEYAVLGRSADGTANGGLAVRSVYTGLQLANEGDELILLAPWGEEVDRVAWGDGTELGVSQGASLERNGFAPGAAWVTAAQSWPGSWGDLGSPNLPYVPRAPALPTVSPTLAPTPLSLPSAWEPAAEPAALAIDEVYYLSADDEYIVLANVGDADADLSGWSIGDAEAPGNAEGVVALPDGRRLAPGQLFVIARNAQAFRARWGRSPDAEIEESDAQIPTLSKRAGWASGVLALNDSGDEVILLDPTFHVADAVAYGEGAPAALHLVGALRVAGGQSLQRVPGFRYPAVAEQRHRFLAAMPQPFDARALPAPQARDRPALGDGLTALWGTLGASSNFSTGGTAPPHFVAAAAAAEGLHFLALADPAPAHGDEVLAAAQGALINLPAWQWRNADGAQAVIYGASSAELATWADLGSFLAANHYVAQAQVAEPPALPGLAAVEADAAGAPGALTPLMRSWRAVGRGLLPAGNALPPIDGFTPAARYTGLAVARTGAEGVLEALTAQRGWLTSAPGIVLSLRVRAGPWMGSAIEPADEATLEIVFADSTGEPAGLALWQDGQPVRTLDVPPSDGRWEVSLPATPGSFLYAVATELDGDFAVTAPLWVTYAGVEPAPVAELSPPPPAQRAVEKLSQADNPAAEAVALKVEQGEAAGAPGSLTTCKLQGLGVPVEFRAQVLAPPELFNSAIYVAEPAEAAPGVAGLGVQVYLRGGVFMPLQEGDWVLVRGQLASFRGELEVSVDQPDQVWRYAAGAPLLPLRVTPGEVGESLEGRLVTFEGMVSGWHGDSIYLCDPAAPDAPVRVTVRSSLDWKRPYVNKGERWLVTGIVSQFAKEHPWNGGYRVLVRYPTDLVRVDGR